MVLWSDALPKIAPRQVLTPPLPQRNLNHAKSAETMGQFPPLTTMESSYSATLKHNKYPSLCFNVAKSFVSAHPPLVSHARSQKFHFSVRSRRQICIVRPIIFVSPLSEREKPLHPSSFVNEFVSIAHPHSPRRAD